MIINNGFEISNEKLDFATQVIAEMQNELPKYIHDGHGPFLAAIYHDKKLIAKSANSVVMDNCSNNHAEMNVIRKVQNILKSYDLSSFDLDLYVTAEPCMMCLGAIMWSGVKSVFYGVPSDSVEKITGFDEGFKPKWFQEFNKRGIAVYGNIKPDLGENVLAEYVKSGEIYKPHR